MLLSELIKQAQELLDKIGDGELYSIHGASGAIDETGGLARMDDYDRAETRGQFDLECDDPADIKPMFRIYIGN